MTVSYFYADNGTTEYLTCSIPLIALIRPIKEDTLSELPSVTKTSAQLSPPTLQGTGDGQFDRPEGIYVDPSGIVYIADTNNARVQKFAPR